MISVMSALSNLGNFNLASPVNQDLEFIVNRRFPQYECDKYVNNFTRIFYCLYLSNDIDAYASFERFYQSVIFAEGIYYVVKSSVVIDGQKLVAYGASFDLNLASDISCFYLSRHILQAKPNFIMPKYLISYPNYRGYCYVIVAFLPLFHCLPFIQSLYEANTKYFLKHLSGVLPYTSSCRLKKEVPYYWTDLFFKMFHTYQGIAMTSGSFTDLSPIEPDITASTVSHGISDSNLLTVKSVLDRSLFEDLVTSLKLYGDGLIRDEGGDERSVYYRLIVNLGKENPIFLERFCVKFSCSYTCTNCPDGIFVEEFYSPFLRVPPNHSFQNLLDNPHTCVMAQYFKGIHTFAEKKCDNVITCYHSCNFANVPRILVFGVDTSDANCVQDLDENLYLKFGSKIYTYIRFASSICFKCYKSKDGVDYGFFYHAYQEGDIPVDEHTYIQCLTRQGFTEANNGNLYTCDTRVFKKMLPGSLHFYQLDNYSNFLPNVDVSHVLRNPQL